MNLFVGTTKEALQKRLIDSYDIGTNTQYLRIRSASDKGRRDNRVRNLSDALQYSYIQPNSSFNTSNVVLDIDRPFDINEIFDKNLPIPNLVIFNPQNLHAHLWYILKDPVYSQRTFKGSRPYKYLTAIYKALVKSLNADRKFNKVLCKNPLHEAWNTVSLREESYKMGDLASHLELNWEDDEPPQIKRNISKKVSIEDVGEYSGASKGNRNADTFNYCRIKAYEYKRTTNCSEIQLLQWTETLVKEVNKNNIPMLDDKECQGIATSISVWTYSNVKTNQIETAKYDDFARMKSLKTRQKKALKKKKRIAKLLKKNPDLSNREISKKLGKGYSTDTVNRLVKILSKEKQQQQQQRETSRQLVVGQVPLNSNCERFVNQVVEAGKPLFKPLSVALLSP